MQYIHKSDFSGLQKIADMINAAYRGIGGEGRWTTEAHLVKGDRIRLQDLEEIIRDEKNDFIVGYLDNLPACCIAIKKLDAITEFGLFAVAPQYQGENLGKSLLNYAEQCARPYSRKFQVTIVSANTSLVEFYQRRGYRNTNKRLPYPDADVGQPLQHLDLLVLQKDV
jgi:Acetyltransferases